MKEKGLLIIIYILSLMSCTKEVEIDLPNHETKLVVNSLFSNDSLLSIHLSKSNEILHSSDNWLNTGTILLFENNELAETYELMPKDSGLFVSSVFPISKNKYALEVLSEDFDDVICSDYMPSMPEVSHISFKDSFYVDEDKIPVSKAHIQIVDNANESNYYEAKFELLYKMSGESSFRFSDAIVYRKNSDMVLQNENLIEYYPKTLIFSDELFNGQVYEMDIDFSGPVHLEYIDGQTIHKGYDFTLIVYLRSISESYYKYKKQLIKHIYFQEGDIWEGIGDPVQMYTNVHGGYGVFAGFSQFVDTICE